MRKLVALVHWIESSDDIYSTDELVREMMNELGYRRLGYKIESRLRDAIRQARP